MKGGETTRGPGNNDSSPRPKARRFSTLSLSLSLSFSTTCPVAFSTAAAFVINLPLSFFHCSF
jgi:hypothetical protein